MRNWNPFILILLLLFFLPVSTLREDCLWLTLSDLDEGRLIFSACLYEGEAVIYKWKNSLFGLNVTETFYLKNESLVLTEIVYEDPYGNPEPLTNPEDLDHLCHEGGPFRAVNISKAYGQIIFGVGQVGKPRIIVRGEVIDLEKEVGFGGRVVVKVSKS